MSNEKILSKVEVKQMWRAYMRDFAIDPSWEQLIMDWVDGHLNPIALSEEMTLKPLSEPVQELLKRKA